MTKELIIKKTINNINLLPEQKVKEVSDFTEFLLSKINDQILTQNIQQVISESKSFEFLNDEEELYSTQDLKEKFH